LKIASNIWASTLKAGSQKFMPHPQKFWDAAFIYGNM